jgi:cell division protein FtsB
MSTRLKRPPFWRHLAVTCALLGFLGYLGYSAMSGQFGIDSREDIMGELAELRAQSAALQAQIDAARHRIALFDTARLDPDILDENARALLNMANPNDMLVMIDRDTGKPIVSLDRGLANNQLSQIISDIPEL